MRVDQSGWGGGAKKDDVVNHIECPRAGARAEGGNSIDEEYFHCIVERYFKVMVCTEVSAASRLHKQRSHFNLSVYCRMKYYQLLLKRMSGSRHGRCLIFNCTPAPSPIPRVLFIGLVKIVI